MQSRVDPTFYRSPGEAIAAPPEELAYVAAYDRAGRAKDALLVAYGRERLATVRAKLTRPRSKP